MRTITTVSMTVLLASQLIACSSPEPEKVALKAEQKIELTSIEVKQHSIPQYYPLTATLEAVNESTVSAQTSGIIESVSFDVNDTVQAGDVIARIKNTEQKATLAQAKASADEAQVSLQRSQKLKQQGTISQGEFDKVEAHFKASQAAFKRAKEQLSYTLIKAPYSGVVKTRHIEAGEVVAPGRAVMTGLSLKQLRAVADMPQHIANQMAFASKKNHQQNTRLVIAKSHISPSKVTIFPYADQQLHSVRIRALLDEADSAQHNLYPGMWLAMQVQVGSRNATLVPLSAVIQNSELSAVYVVNNKDKNTQVKLRQVRLAQIVELDGVPYQEISAGLSAGEMIATNGYAVMAQQ